MDSFSLEALAVPSAHKCRALVSDRQQFPPLLISKSTAYEPNPEICLPRRGVSRYYLQICFLERAPRSAALGAVRTHPRSSRRLPHPFQHAGHGGAPLRARRALAPPLRICCYRYLVAVCYLREAVSRQDSIGFRSRCHARAARRRGARRGGGAHGEGSHHRARGV